MELEICCKICSNPFIDPVILPCNDCACLKCLLTVWDLEEQATKYKRSSGTYPESNKIDDWKFICPICSQITRIPPGGITNFPRYKIVEPVIENIRSKASKKAYIPCDFCEDYKQQNASFKCVQCNFNYCALCFGSAHVMKGPFAMHDIISPTASRDTSYNLCNDHHLEEKKLFCFDCNLCVCFLCKEIGKHKNHKTELVITLFEKEKLALNSLNACIEVRVGELTKAVTSSEDYALFTKSSGLETESHVLRECNQLIKIIEQMKQQLLEEISNRYNETMEMTMSFIENMKQNQLSLKAMQELSVAASSTTDFVGTLESLVAYKHKLNLHMLQSEGNIIRTMEHQTQLPYCGMVLDLSNIEEHLSLIDWLKPPDAPSFHLSNCFAKNDKIVLSWISPKGRIDSFILERENKQGVFEKVYQGKTSTDITVNVDYGENSRFRVCAENTSGKGKYSEYFQIFAEKGLHFEVDTEHTHKDVQLSHDHMTIRSKAKEEIQKVYGDVVLSRGVHYWKIKVDKLNVEHSKNGYIIVGLEQISDEGRKQYGVLISNQKQELEDSPVIAPNRITLKDVTEQDFTFVLNIKQSYFDVFMNGVLITNNVTDDHSYSGILNTHYVPLISLKQIKTQITFITGLEMPKEKPGKAAFVQNKCFSDNTCITFHWIRDDATVDAYRLEIFNEIEMISKTNTIYIGNKDSFNYDARDYNKTLYARLYCVNIAGVGECSDLLVMKTEKGLNFSFRSIEHPNLQLLSSNRSVKYSSDFPIVLFGDCKLSEGIHFWKFSIEQFQGKSTNIGIGLAKYGVGTEEFGSRDSYALNIQSREPDETPMQTINMVKKKKEILRSEFALLLDLYKRRLYCYNNGSLIAKTTKGLLAIPQVTWSFKNIPSDLYPAVRCSGRIKFSVFCNQTIPKIPAPPSFRDCLCDNITCYYNWRASEELGSYTNYCVLKVYITSTGNGQKTKKSDAFKEVYRGPLENHTLKQLPYNSKVTATVTAVNCAGESKESEKIILFTAKGFFFEFDKNKKSNGLKLLNNNQTVSLSSPVHSYALGNQVISQGFHSWKIKIEAFAEQSKMGVIGIGVASSLLNDPILGEDSTSYGVQVIEHPKVLIRHTEHRHQLQMTSSQAIGSIIVVEINMDDHWINIFVNGSQLRRNQNAVGSPTFDNVYGNVYPAVSMYGSNVQLTILDNDHS